VTGRFKVWGHLTDTSVDDHHCGSYPELVTTRFEPWGTIKRCTSIGSLGDELHHFTEGQPTGHYVASDYQDGPAPPLIDDDSCVARTADCAAGLVAVTGCDDARWCCRLRR